ncbi:MerR family transcriptional regulator [Nostoc sp. C057]|uniref:MerR family transcriptional regulator n=1 Tax=Nostoc sp. C057 TaxID=2576903 RepID=UPI0015C3046F|nr:MerR family transcriptional regulator [Nostoc sp. C057]
MSNLFSRQEVLKLTGLSSGQLSRLDKSGVVEPTKLGSESHPVVLYTLNQVLELRAIARLREQLSMQEIRKVVDYIRKHGFDKSLSGKFLIFCNEHLYWVKSDESVETIVKLSGKNKGQVVIKAIHPIGDILSDLEKEIQRRESASSKKSNQKTPAGVN